MHLEILTPGKKVFSGEIKLVQVPGSGGSFEVMENHATIISTLDQGTIKVITNDDQTQQFSIDSGVIQVIKNEVIVLAETLLS
jgi:F-type H+-transporting ATPase subunit epsilon